MIAISLIRVDSEKLYVDYGSGQHRKGLMLSSVDFSSREKMQSLDSMHSPETTTLRGLNFARIKFRGSLHPRNFNTFAGI